MTKIITKLPVTAEALKDFRENALKKNIEEAVGVIEESFSILCNEITNRFNANEWIYMQDKDVYYINDIVGLMPNLNNYNRYTVKEYENYTFDASKLKFSNFDGDLMTDAETRKCFNDKISYFRSAEGSVGGYRGITFKWKNQYWYRYFYNNSYKGTTKQHGNRTDNDSMVSIPIFRFNGENSAPATAAAAILYWLKYDLTPQNFKSGAIKDIFNTLKTFYAKYKTYLKADGVKIILDRAKIFSAVLAGTEFDFLLDAKKLLAATEVDATDDFVKNLKDDLLNCDKVRAELDPYDENILIDPNRGHWDLWDYGEGAEKAGEITLAEGLTARDPVDDINHGIVAIDFGTKSTVVVYENDRLQILPLQVGAGKYGEGIKAENYENPTVIQFINLEKFVADYKTREGRPKTEWNDVTVSHTAFKNLINSDSKHYYSFLTGLKHWCGSNERLKLKDRQGVTKDLSPFLELMEHDINPLEYYAYYLGLYINNMLQEKRIFLKYIMSFPVTYDNAIRERMRRAFERGLKKSLPTALLSNENAMKNFVVQDGASEPAAYAITALQEYAFDPEGDEENYYAVFDFGGGTTDFDFGVLRESELDRYDYTLIHFGENGDQTLGGENLLKLLAFEVFKANQATLLKPKEQDNSVGKIQFTLDADKKDFVGSLALIKDSQEANQNMYKLAEALRCVWEEPESEQAKKIFDSGTIEVDLFTDNKNFLSNIQLGIAFENSESLDLRKILRDRIEQGIRNFFIAMKEAFLEGSHNEDLNIKPLAKIDEISIFLAGNSSKSKMVMEIFSEYLGEYEILDDPIEEFPFDEEGILKFGYTLKDDYEIKDTGGLCLYKNVGKESRLIGLIDNPDNREAIMAAVQKWKNSGIGKKNKAQEIFGFTAEQMPKFKIYPALGTEAARKIQKARGVEVNPNDLAAPTGKTGVAFGLLKCRDSGNVQIIHVTPDKNKTPFQFYVGRNKKRKFKPVIDKNTRLGEWYAFIDAGNSFDILYSDLPEAITGSMDVSKARRINVTLTECNPQLTVFIRAVKSNIIEYQIAEDIDDLNNPQKLQGAEPYSITLS